MADSLLLKCGVITLLIQIMLYQSKGQNVSICAIKPVKCVKSNYRTYDGYCNNLKHPEWGTTFSRYFRLIPSNYGDGISTPSVAKDGTPLPNAREVSFTVYPAVYLEDCNLTLNVMQYGQILAHDISMTIDNNQTKAQNEPCCSVDGRLLKEPSDPNICYSILIPKSDPVYTKLGIQCFPFQRTGTDFEYGCGQKNKPVQQLTRVNQIIDLSFVYGQNDEGNKALRLFKGGKLKYEHRLGQDWLPRGVNVSGFCTILKCCLRSFVQLTRVNQIIDLSFVYGQNDEGNKALRLFKGGKLKYEHRLGQDWLPRGVNVSGFCTIVDPKDHCYLAGDIRVNQNPHLVILQTIFLREHNRLANALAKLNSKWNDEKLFQEARKINIGQHQKIVYYDLLPYLLGRQNMLKRKLIYERNGFVNDYSDEINPSVFNEHSTAAFRFYHSNIAGYLDLVNEKRKIEDEARISDSFNRPRILEQRKVNFNELTRGLVTQHQLLSDEYHDREITNYWARRPGANIGLDLKAICIQRSRDHGLATYNDFRAYCGFPRAKTFEDFLDFISKENVKKLKQLYKSPDDVEATVGGSLEELVPKTLGGPTFLCIMTEQFYRMRVGDRFFFENSGETGFTLDQLKEIRKASVSKLICDNTDIKQMQPDGFYEITSRNPLMPCNKLPSVNLKFWRE